VLNHNENDTILKGTYLNWLEAFVPKNIFWIRGKAGSGKSTLMRYLDEQVGKYILEQAELRQRNQALHWLGQTELLIASCYFWSAGTAAQKIPFGPLTVAFISGL
jgi:ABC-type lipoprotein export system ATPase subunit